MVDRPGVVTRVLLAIFAAGGLASIFLFQHTDILCVLWGTDIHPEWQFIANRFFRIFFNDAFMLLLLYALFADAKILRLAVLIQMVDLFVLFPLYLFVKLSLEGPSEISTPFLSQFHRLIVHPTLMILVIPAIYYQRFILKRP